MKYWKTIREAETIWRWSNYLDGVGDRYYDFFAWQIPDLSYIHLSRDSYEENDLRRMKYRFLTLEQKTGG
jgi:hypothetical protein